MRLMTEGFYLPDYIDAVISFIETGECPSECSWQSKEDLIKKMKDYNSSQQVFIVNEIKRYFANNGEPLSVNSNPVEDRTIDFFSHFDAKTVQKGEEQYDHDCDVRLIMTYIKYGKYFATSAYQSKEKFFEKLSQCCGEKQQALILDIKLCFDERSASSFSGYFINFLKKSPIDPACLRLKEVLAVFDPKHRKAVVDQLAKERDLSNTKCCIM